VALPGNPVFLNGERTAARANLRHLLPRFVRRAGARLVAERRASVAGRELAALATSGRPILAGPWLGEVGFELLYWIPFLRWFVEHYDIDRERLIAVSRGGSAAAWYGALAGRWHDALSFVPPDEYRRKNRARTNGLGEEKQVAPAAFDEEIVALVRNVEGRDIVVLHPSTMYRLFAPYWWGHQPIEWVRRYARFVPIQPPLLDLELPAGYTAVKFYFNDCFHDTPANRAFVERAIQSVAEDGPVVSLSMGVAVDEHVGCGPDIEEMRGIAHLLAPDTNLALQSAIVARARRFVGTYGGFAYLAPLCGVPAVSYYSEPDSFSTRHLDLVRDVLRSDGRTDLLQVLQVPQGGDR
jgi:hypothetical protein